MLSGIFALAGFGFIVYLIWRFYKTTPTDKSVGERIWLALVAAAMSFAAALTAWFHSTP